VRLAETEAGHGQRACGPMKKGKVFHVSRTRQNKTAGGQQNRDDWQTHTWPHPDTQAIRRDTDVQKTRHKHTRIDPALGRFKHNAGRMQT
jgi:hypothetical protein